MNKSFIKNLLFVVAISVFLPCVVTAGDGWMHETSSNGQGCKRCHAVHRTLGSAGYNNICLNCHRLGRIDQGLGRQIAPFSQGDMATVQGPSQGVLDPNKTQSSHRWEGSDDVPRAGAAAPINQPAGMEGKRNAYVGQLYCARCHGVHDTSLSAPFLRIASDQDQLCLNCHRSRNNTTHDLGSHPVNVDYNTIATQFPNEYYNPPRNSNPANKTADLGNKLPQGKVLCSTCHSIHYGDSNSRTFDNVSSAKFSGLSSSKGYLLRTDMYGKTSADINICTNCHKTTDENGVPDVNPYAKVMNHNGGKPPKQLKPQNIQCLDCHGGHVDEGDKTTPNKFLIRRFMAVSSAAGRNPKVMFQYTGSRRNFNKDAFGVCVACHATLPDDVNEHKNNTSAVSCDTCHKHNTGFTARCNWCHGYPPGNPALGYAGTDEASTPHVSHAGGADDNSFYKFNCDQCHKSNQHNLVNKTYQDVFINTSSSGIIAGLSAKYAKTTHVCNNVYCHSNGSPRPNINPAVTVSPIFKSVTWDNGLNQIIPLQASVRCASCHDLKPATNSHNKHIITYNYGCVTCHADTVTVLNGTTVLQNNARLVGGSHVNGVKDVKFSGAIGDENL